MLFYPRVHLCLAVVLTLIRTSKCATKDDIVGVYSLYENEAPNGACPQVIRHFGHTSGADDTGYIRIGHNNMSMGTSARCASAETGLYTAMLDADALETQISSNNNLFPLASRTDLGLLRQLRSVRSLLGVQMYTNLTCGKYSFRQGTLVAFVKNSTFPVPMLGLPLLLDGPTYLLMLENGVPNPKRCVYRTSTPKQVKSNRPDCFPAHTRVALQNNLHVRMDLLQHGATIRTGVDHMPHSRVFTFSHRDHHSYTRFIRFTTESGAQLTVSPRHYVFSRGLMRPARTIRVGDVLDTAAEVERVQTIKVDVLSRGIFNPHSESGTMLVGDNVAKFHVSCYTESVHPILADVLLAPLRLAHRISGFSTTFLDGDSHLRSLARYLPTGPLQLRW